MQLQEKMRTDDRKFSREMQDDSQAHSLELEARREKNALEMRQGYYDFAINQAKTLDEKQLRNVGMQMLGDAFDPNATIPVLLRQIAGAYADNLARERGFQDSQEARAKGLYGMQREMHDLNVQENEARNIAGSEGIKLALSSMPESVPTKEYTPIGSFAEGSKQFGATMQGMGDQVQPNPNWAGIKGMPDIPDLIKKAWLKRVGGNFRGLGELLGLFKSTEIKNNLVAGDTKKQLGVKVNRLMSKNPAVGKYLAGNPDLIGSLLQSNMNSPFKVPDDTNSAPDYGSHFDQWIRSKRNARGY